MAQLRAFIVDLGVKDVDSAVTILEADLGVSTHAEWTELDQDGLEEALGVLKAKGVTLGDRQKLKNAVLL